LGRGKTFAAFSAITALESLLEMNWIVEYSIGADADALVFEVDCPWASEKLINKPIESVILTIPLDVFIVLTACWSCKDPISHLLNIIAARVSTQARVQVDERCNSSIADIRLAVGVKPTLS
jgi:hypothetical protein